ncbi:thermonuclease family protein [Candidatus Collierbacteria bacterium]|nr:thermonuclease family protein [Candidatus Collierbacteria bacterium]
MKKLKWKFVLGLCSAIIFFTGLAIGWKAKPQTGTLYSIVEVVDGDTFLIANRQPIRLYGLDAPELPNCYGLEAKAQLVRQIQGKSVELRDILTEGYGRILAMVYVDGKLINEDLIRNGFGLYKGQGNTATKSLKDAGEYARNNHLGIFSQQCYQVTSPDSNCAIKGNIDHVKKAKVYYPPKCKTYNSVDMELYLGDVWFCSESEARKAGFSLAPTCQ